MNVYMPRAERERDWNLCDYIDVYMYYVLCTCHMKSCSVLLFWCGLCAFTSHQHSSFYKDIS